MVSGYRGYSNATHACMHACMRRRTMRRMVAGRDLLAMPMAMQKTPSPAISDHSAHSRPLMPNRCPAVNWNTSQRRMYVSTSFVWHPRMLEASKGHADHHNHKNHVQIG
jgi:hypothetical protein